MDGVFFITTDTANARAGKELGLELILRRDNLEIMRQTLSKKDFIWITPGDDPSLLEFFFVLSGEIVVTTDDGDTLLHAGESFYVRSLSHDIRLNVPETAEVLYIVNRPQFDMLDSYHSELGRLLDEIDNKDHFTLQHSKNVLQYSATLFEALHASDEGAVFDDLAAAALFHDVGKCRVSDAILKKQGRYTPEEYTEMKVHALESGEMLADYFNKNVAAIARNHHERLDGSGYPAGLRADSIGLSDRIISVADAFDAMTGGRSYSIKKTFEEAANELCTLPEKYDARICSALRELVRQDKIHPFIKELKP